MKIRLGIIDDDSRYTTRLIGYFNAHYSDKLEIFAFSLPELLSNYLKEARLDVLLADPDLVPEGFTVPKTMQLAYFSNTADIETIRGVRTLCKYQKTELIYKEILNLL